MPNWVWVQIAIGIDFKFLRKSQKVDINNIRKKKIYSISDLINDNLYDFLSIPTSKNGGTSSLLETASQYKERTRRVRFPKRWTELFWHVLRIIHVNSDLVDGALLGLSKFKVCFYLQSEFFDSLWE